MKGICCACQSVHEVMHHTLTPAESDYLEYNDISHQEREIMVWVMAPHRIFGDTGVECEGAGTNPQTLVKNVNAK